MFSLKLAHRAKRLFDVPKVLLLAALVRSPKGRLWLEKELAEIQFALGIGSGADVRSSGERLLTDLLRKTAETTPELCIFDVGSNQGQFLQLVRKELAGLAYRVHCFEPSPSTFAILQRTAADSAEVSLNALGLGRTPGEFDLFSDGEGSELASLSQRRLEHFGLDFSRRERVRIETLDRYCAEHRVERIDLLKIDVEGHELDVLNGGTRMFSESRIGMATFEFGGCNIDSRTFFQDYFYFFQTHRLPHLFRLLPSGKLHRIGAYTEALEQFRTTNFIALSDPAAHLAGLA